MVRLNIFHFIPKNSPIHKIDPRIKLICLLLYTIAIISADWLGYALASLFVFILIIIAKLPIIILIKELKYFIFLIFLVIIIRSFSMKGEPLFYPWKNGPTIEGLIFGLLYGWKISLIVFFSTFFISTTQISKINKALQWYFRPIPFLPEKRIATLISLVINLFPLIFDQASEMMEAQKARCIENIKNPIKRLRLSVFPIIVRTFQRADDIAYAMESRCYSEAKDNLVLLAKPKLFDWISLLITVAFLALIVIIKFNIISLIF